MESEDFAVIEGTGRRKKRDKTSWKKEILKTERYKPKSLPKKPNCQHKKKTLQCSDLPMQDIRRFHESFYSNKDKISQDNFILKYTSQMNPKRRRPSEKGGSQKGVTISYYVRSKSLGMLQICNKAFLDILGISKFRVQNICKQHLILGKSPVENRGGDTRSKKYNAKKQKVRNFIKNLKCVESHYTRSQSVRQYFPSDCSVRKLWRSYNSEVEIHNQVKYHFFWDIFMNDFNISFKSPSTDACSECIRLKSLISTLKDQDKILAMTQYRVHKMKAKAFHEMLRKRTDGVFKFSFDCQKNLVLPKVPDQAAYYSRQLYQYNMTICEGHSKNKQTPATVNIFTWSEDQRFKGSNEIASIVYYYLCNADLNDIETIEIFSDGCPGQNKNITMIGMLAKWLLLDSPNNIKFINFIFPVVGHSYIPPDRIFGRIEKEIRKKDTIIDPQEYKDIFAKYGTVKNVGIDVPVYDWKSSVATNVKAPGQLHFQFAAAKRMILKKNNNSIVIKGEVNYRSDIGSFKPFLKKGKGFHLIKPDQLQSKVPVKAEKIGDVHKLLSKHFGDNWVQREDLKFYREVLKSIPEEHAEEIDNEDLQQPPQEANELRI